MQNWEWRPPLVRSTQRFGTQYAEILLYRTQTSNKTYKNITDFTKTWVSGKTLLVIKQENVDNTFDIISKSQLSKTKHQSNNVESHLQIVPYKGLA